MSVNKAIVVGNLGADPEVRSLPSGTRVATMSVATNRHWKDRDGNPQEATEWHRIEAFGMLAELSEQYLRKGRKVYVEGRLQTDKWTDRDGRDRYTTKIVAYTIKFLDRPDRESRPAVRDDGGGAGRSEFGEADIPF